MTKKALILLSALAALAIGCGKTDPVSDPVNQDPENPENPENPSDPSYGNGGVYSETFEGYDGKVKSEYKARETFTSKATGVTWTLDYGSIMQTEDQACFTGGYCFTMGGKSGKDDDGQSVLYTSTLADGITKLEFDYVANANKKLEVQVLVGGKTVWTSGVVNLTNNGQTDTKVLQHLSYDITGASSDAVLKFTNISAARRISLGHISWTNATGKGGNGSSFEGGSQGGNGGEGGGQDDSDFTMTTASVLAEYYGDYYESGTENWCLAMTSSNGKEEIYVEFFTALGVKDPVGTYTVDATESMAAGTALPGYIDEDSYIWPTYYFNDATQDFALISSGTLTVTKNGNDYTVTADFKDEEGGRICSSYTGPITIREGELEDDDDDDDDDDEDIEETTLTSDVTVSNITFAEADYWGDAYESGTNDWTLSLENEAGDCLVLEFFTDLAAKTPEGSYTVDLTYSFAKGTMFDGYFALVGLAPSYYNTKTEEYAYLASGTLTIAKSGDNYTVTAAFKDANGHNISANYSGKMTVAEGQYEDYSSLSVKKAAPAGVKCLARVQAPRPAGHSALRFKR